MDCLQGRDLGFVTGHALKTHEPPGGCIFFARSLHGTLRACTQRHTPAVPVQEVLDRVARIAPIVDSHELDVEELVSYHRLSSGRAFPMNPYLVQSIAVERVEDGTWLFPCEEVTQSTRGHLPVETGDSLIRRLRETLRAVASCGLWPEQPRLHVHTDGGLKVSPLGTWRRIARSDSIVEQHQQQLESMLVTALSGQKPRWTHTPVVPPDLPLKSLDAREKFLFGLRTVGAELADSKPSRWINCVDSGDRGAANLGVFLVPAANAVIKIVDLEFAYGTHEPDQSAPGAALRLSDNVLDSLTIHASLGEAGLAPRLLGVLPHQRVVEWVESHGLSDIVCPRHRLMPRLLGLVMEYIPMAWNVPKRCEAPPDWRALSDEDRRESRCRVDHIESMLDHYGIWAEDIQLFVDREQRIVLGDLDPYRFATPAERSTGRLNDLSALKTALLKDH